MIGDMNDPALTGHVLQAFLDIAAERQRQEDLRTAGKFKSTCATQGVDEMSNFARYCVLGEEFGEVGRALNENASIQDLREELIQVAAVCVAWVQYIDTADTIMEEAINESHD